MNGASRPDRLELERWLVEAVNGSLEDSEARRRLDALLASDPACAAEKRFLEALRATLKTLEAPSPGDFGWRRLRRELEAPPRRKPWRVAALAASLLLAVQAGLWLGSRGAGDALVPLAEAPQGAAVLQVTFRPDATEAEIRAALNAVGGRLVGGPGALGVYRIALDDERAVEQAIARLRGYDFVEHVGRE